MPAGWDHQVVEYTGNGVDNRLILTDIDLTQGKVAIFIFPVSTNPFAAAHPPVFRHSTMSDTTVDGSTTPISTGIKTFTATGFTVGTHVSVNQNTTPYIALILQDTTALGTWMQIGSYTGTQVGIATSTEGTPTGVTTTFDAPGYPMVTRQGNLQIGGHTPAAADGIYNAAGWEPINANQFYCFLFGQGNGNGGNVWDPDILTTAVPVTHTWLGGRSHLFSAAEMDTGDSFTLRSGSGLTNRLTTQTTVGSNVDANGGSVTYYFVSLDVTADLRAAGLYIARRSGAATITPGFTPGVAFAQSYVASATARYRSQNSDAGLQSQAYSATPDNLGITAIDATSFTVALGGDHMVWAWSDRATPPPEDAGPIDMPPGDDTGQQGGSLAGCNTDLGTGTDSGGGSGCGVALG